MSTKELEAAVAAQDASTVAALVDQLPADEVARTMVRLSDELGAELVTLLSPSRAAALIQELPDSESAELLERLPVSRAAEILDRMASDRQADLLAAMDPQRSTEVLAAMTPEEARNAQALIAYRPDTAGGVMVTEYLAYPRSSTVAEILADLRQEADRYAGYPVQYLYLLESGGDLVGVVPFRDLLFADGKTPAVELMRPHLVSVSADTDLDSLRRLFLRHRYFGFPVVDAAGRLVGVALESDVENALRRQTDRALLRISGLFGPEEFRTMPLAERAFYRMSWLLVSLGLNLLAASIIRYYEQTLAAAIALAAFLPVVSALGGNTGYQAAALSMRELSLGLVRPVELAWVLGKEITVGVINGLILALVVGGIATVWTGDARLALAIGSAMGLGVIFACALGGVLPLLLRRVSIDPALASGPLLTTLTDSFGFFATLYFAHALLGK